MITVDVEALQWLRKIRLTLIARRVPVRRTLDYDLCEAGWQRARRAKAAVRDPDDVTPEEILTRALSSASRKALRYMRRYELQRADREDILNEALAWCWENRDNYSLTTSLDTWFINAVRDAHKKFRLNQKRTVYYGNLRV